MFCPRKTIQCRNCKIWSSNINITAAVLTGPRQQYNNSESGTNFRYGRHAYSTRNETIAWQHMQFQHGGHDIALDFQVLTSIYCQKRIKVKVKSKRITNSTVCVNMISTSFMKISNQTSIAYQIYKIFWVIFWSYFVAFLGDSISINRPKCKPISIQWARCRSQLYFYPTQGG